MSEPALKDTELRDESFAAVHEEPLSERMAAYLAALVKQRSPVIHFSTGAGHIFHDLVARWPKLRGYDSETRAICTLITETVYRLAAKLYAQAVDISIAIAPPPRVPPVTHEEMATYIAIDLEHEVVRSGFLAPGFPTPEELREPVKAGVTILCRPRNYGYHMIKEGWEYGIGGKTSGLPVRDPSNRDRDVPYERLPEPPTTTMPRFAPVKHAETRQGELEKTLEHGAEALAAGALLKAGQAKAAAAKPGQRLELNRLEVPMQEEWEKSRGPDYRELRGPSNLTLQEAKRHAAVERTAGAPEGLIYREPDQSVAPDYRRPAAPDYHNESTPEFERARETDYRALGPDTREIEGPDYATRGVQADLSMGMRETGAYELPQNRGPGDMLYPDYRRLPYPDYHSENAPEFERVRETDHRTLGPDNREWGNEPEARRGELREGPEQYRPEAPEQRRPETPERHETPEARHEERPETLERHETPEARHEERPETLERHETPEARHEERPETPERRETPEVRHEERPEAPERRETPEVRHEERPETPERRETPEARREERPETPERHETPEARREERPEAPERRETPEAQREERPETPERRETPEVRREERPEAPERRETPEARREERPETPERRETPEVRREERPETPERRETPEARREPEERRPEEHREEVERQPERREERPETRREPETPREERHPEPKARREERPEARERPETRERREEPHTPEARREPAARRAEPRQQTERREEHPEGRGPTEHREEVERRPERKQEPEIRHEGPHPEPEARREPATRTEERRAESRPTRRAKERRYQPEVRRLTDEQRATNQPRRQMEDRRQQPAPQHRADEKLPKSEARRESTPELREEPTHGRGKPEEPAAETRRAPASPEARPAKAENVSAPGRPENLRQTPSGMHSHAPGEMPRVRSLRPRGGTRAPTTATQGTGRAEPIAGLQHPIGVPRAGAEEKLLNLQPQHGIYTRIQQGLKKIPLWKPGMALNKKSVVPPAEKRAQTPKITKKPEAKPANTKKRILTAAQKEVQRHMLERLWKRFLPHPGLDDDE